MDRIGACDEFGIQLIEVIENCVSTSISTSELLKLIPDRRELIKLHENAHGDAKGKLAKFLAYDEAYFERMAAFPLVAVAKLKAKMASWP